MPLTSLISLAGFVGKSKIKTREESSFTRSTSSLSSSSQTKSHSDSWWSKLSREEIEALWRASIIFY